ncbi:hypothetical protein [Bacillus sp. P14.5]|uniref:hypothetical protein n=1 Tax=Bacillus sp. P14.5 TaxID=1983400 RepID=UPI0013B056B2|nr:hypothetical protein [Bacillus sp. P14.5]
MSRPVSKVLSGIENHQFTLVVLIIEENKKIITGSVFEYIIKNYKSKGVPNRIDVDTPFLLV